MIRPRWRRRVAITVLAVALVGAVVGLAVTGTGEPASALRLLTGDAWLDNASAGTVSHVSGYTGRADTQTTVGRPGDPFEVVQRADGAYVLDLRTGKLLRLGDSTLSVVSTAAETGTPAALQVVAGTSTTWVIDHSSGIVQQVNPSTLTPIGRQIPLGGRTGAGLVDATGSLWVPLITPGAVAKVTPNGTVSRQPFGHPGDLVQMADTSAGVWGVDAEAAKAAPLQEHTSHPVPLPASTAGPTPLVGSSPTSADLVVVERTEVLEVDTSQSSLSSLALPAAADATQVAVSQGRAYLLDPVARQLQTVNLSPLQALPPVTVPPGSTQLVSKDNLVFVNSPDSPQALVVNSDGAVTDIAKYVPATPVGPSKTGRGSSRGPGGRGSGQATAPQSTPGPSVGVPIGSSSPFTGPAGTAPPVPSTASPAPVASTATTNPPPAPVTTQPPTVPGVPMISQISAGDGTVTVTWVPPNSDGGSPVLRYQVTATPGGNSRTVSAPTTTAALIGLADGVRACVQVQAVNRIGAGPLSPAGVSCATPLKNSPGRVGGLQAKASAPGQIALSWSQPLLGAYNTAIKSYTVTGGPATRTVTTTSTMITGLASDRTYSFTVVATNMAGNSGPASAAVSAATWSAPEKVASLTVTAGDGSLTIKWGKASVPTGSPAVTKYEVSIGGSTSSTAVTTLTRSVTAWTNETVKVYAVNPVGNGPTTTATGSAWVRVSTVLCHDVLSGDVAVLNQNLCPTGGAWVPENNSAITWISAQAGHAAPAVVNEYLCVTYYTGAVSGDLYALVGRPTQAACTAALPLWQKPDIPHVIAYVSTKPLGRGSQHVCEYAGTTTGTSPGKWDSYELGLRPPSGLTGASSKFCFYT